MRILLFIVVFIWMGCGQKKSTPIVIKEVSLGPAEQLGVPENLSEWNFFTTPIHNLEPREGILPYDLNTPLFTDYAHKLRFVKLPDGKKAEYHPTEVMDFPLGTILIKNFYYPADFSKPKENIRIIETRLLIHEEVGWNAFTYVWDDEQTDAKLEISGATVPVKWKNEKGVLTSIDYSVPNLVQCKSCHEKSARMSPIGPTARQLNRVFEYDDGSENQLTKWAVLGLLDSIPEIEDIPKLPVWDNEDTGDLAARARAWLEINCAHCHRKEGPAKNTGLYLLASEKDQYKLGINKPPVAAGRGSAGLKYAIVPGEPQKSILFTRINSLDPGVMMPELGRKTVHKEGVELIRNWILSL